MSNEIVDALCLLCFVIILNGAIIAIAINRVASALEVKK